MEATVFSHLVQKFGVHPENLATEALGFILDMSPVARGTFNRVLRQLDFNCAEDITYRTQITDENNTRPDIVGTVPSGARPVLVEAKFWAGLMDSQPVGYLKSLPPEGGILLFVAPSQRIDTLWAELLRRCRDAGLEGGSSCPAEYDFRQIRIEDKVLALTSWRVLLDVVEGALDRAADHTRVADVRQLRSLCERMDTEAFLPLQSEELTGTIGRRVFQLCELPDALTDILVSRGIAEVKGLRAAAMKGRYGRYLLLKGYGTYLYFCAKQWARHGATPLWITIKGPGWKRTQMVPDALAAADISFHERSYVCDSPIFLPLGVERDAVVQGALDQILRIAAALPEVDRGSIDTEPPPVTESEDAEDEGI